MKENSLFGPREGFTLAELLIALAILGVIATFTIPKILDSGSSGQSDAKFKEFLGTISGAYQNLKKDTNISNATTVGALTPYINYVSVLTAGQQIDRAHTFAGALTCNAPGPCYQMHNGGVIYMLEAENMTSVSDQTSAFRIWFDPDGIAGNTGTTNGPSKSAFIFLYSNGRVTTLANAINPTCYNTICSTPSGTDPDWLTWGN